MQRKTKQIMSGVFAAALASSVAGCAPSSSVSLPSKPGDKRCSDYDWNDSLGVYECDDNSRYHGHYFHNGGIYTSKSALKNSSSYKSYKSSSSFKGGSKGSVRSSGGFGSGSKGGFGG